MNFLITRNLLRRKKLNILRCRYGNLLHVVPIQEAKRFITECMVAVNASQPNADIIAEALVLSDYRGHAGHGMYLLGQLVKLVVEKFINPHATPSILKETKSAAMIDGHNGFGYVVSKFSVSVAAKKAKESGVGFVVARNSHYNRMLAYSNLQALPEGLITLCSSNTPACMSPEPLKGAILGSNPFSASAPGEKDDYFLLDISSTEASFGKIDARKRKNIPLPLGWAKDKLGRITISPDDAMEAKMLLPIGGSAGFGMALCVEMLCSVISGSKSMLNVSHEFQNTTTMCHSFLCINPDYFAPNFKARMNEFLSFIRQMDPIKPEEPVLIPGDPERSFMEEVDKLGGLVYSSGQLDTCKKLSTSLKVEPLKTIVKQL